jgi:hypothetical protein
MDRVYIRKVYRAPARSAVWGSYVLAQEELGTWLFTPKGSTYRAEQDGVVIGTCDVGQGRGSEGCGTLHFSPAGGWWFARWDERGVFYVDFAAPTAVVGEEWQYVDLYLDLHQVGDGPLLVDDEDEFEEACARRVVTHEEQRAVLAAKQQLLEEIAEGRGPFDGRAWDRLSEALALRDSGIRDLPTLLIP